MKVCTFHSPVLRQVRSLLAALIISSASALSAQTLWYGDSIMFYHDPDADNLSDTLTDEVTLTRAGSGGLYNSDSEIGATAGTSPADTEWAIGDLYYYDSLSYGPCPLEAGNHPPGYIGTNFVVHLIDEDIYLSLTLTDWGGAGGSGDNTFGYIRSTPGGSPPPPPAPSISITNPVTGVVYAAPVNVKLGASATVSTGTVTNVTFISNGTNLGQVLSSPFNLTTTSLAAGSYAITAIATAAGVAATSSVVNISVVTPVPLTTFNPTNNAGQFSFNYNANVGLTYIVRRSTNMTAWTPIKTNLATSSLSSFSEPFLTNASRFYDVERLPNP